MARERCGGQAAAATHPLLPVSGRAPPPECGWLDAAAASASAWPSRRSSWSATKASRGLPVLRPASRPLLLEPSSCRLVATHSAADAGDKPCPPPSAPPSPSSPWLPEAPPAKTPASERRPIAAASVVAPAAAAHAAAATASKTSGDGATQCWCTAASQIRWHTWPAAGPAAGATSCQVGPRPGSISEASPAGGQHHNTSWVNGAVMAGMNDVLQRRRGPSLAAIKPVAAGNSGTDNNHVKRPV